MIFVIIALICWGLWGIFDKKALEKSTNYQVIITHYVLHALQIPILICILNVVSPGWHLSYSIIMWSLLAAIAYAVASFAYLTAMSEAEASYVLGVTACYPVIAIGLAVLFLNETIVLSRLIGAAVVCCGVVAISAPTFKKDKQKFSKLVTICVAAATLSWAIWGIVDKKAVSVAGPLEVCLAKYIWDLFILPILFKIYKGRVSIGDICHGRTIYFCSLSAVCLAFGAWAYLTAMTHYSASYVISITACYPVIMYFLAVVFLKERFNRLRSAGIILVVTGGILVQNAQTVQAIDRAAIQHVNIISKAPAKSSVML